MPKPQEIAEIVVGGRRFSDWTSVQVDLDYETQTRLFTFTTAEPVSGASARTFNTLQIKPGDAAQVFLAGKKVAEGFVFQRQASYDAKSHAVLISGRSKVGDIVDSSVPMKATQFKNSSLPQVARKLLEPFGIELKVENPSKSFEKPFKDLNPIPGESVWAFLDRLTRQRQMFLHDDPDGNCVMARIGDAGPVADLEEGRNILSANCLIRDDLVFQKVAAMQQQRGDDNTDGDQARKPAGAIDDAGSKRHRPLTIIAEQPGDKEDMADRAQFEWNVLLGNIIQATIRVQGWLKDDGALWNWGEVVKVISPMLLLKHELAVKSVLFAQDTAQGTTTTLTLVRPEALGKVAKEGVAPGSGGILPGGSKKEAKPEEEDI